MSADDIVCAIAVILWLVYFVSLFGLNESGRYR